MRKTIFAAAIAGLLSASANARDFEGIPSEPGSGETGYFHFQLVEFPGVNFCIPSTPANGATLQTLQWSLMVEMRADTGRKTIIHAGGEAPQGCMGRNDAFTVTGVGIP